ncbi:hypothetical protein HK100_005504 [Physocladia obscura]|uniref:Uncharacterized protein n=1 Tax=Physocladia obscura TaxID=109957 RepID=A0AAD5SSD3_9FUNG|nr:hypothetical protein HK100_005504 [Physocladia obscura]
MAIYNAIKNRNKGKAAKALIDQAFPGDMRAQIMADNAEIVLVYQEMAHARTASQAEAAAEAAAEARAARAQQRRSLFASLFASTPVVSSSSLLTAALPITPPNSVASPNGTAAENENSNDKDNDSQNDINGGNDEDDDEISVETVTGTGAGGVGGEDDGEGGRDGGRDGPLRPQTPAPAAPSPVDLNAASTSAAAAQLGTSPAKHKATLLSRLGLNSLSLSNNNNNNNNNNYINADSNAPPTSPSISAQSPTSFDPTKTRPEATAAILLLWAVTDALKKAAKARKVLNLHKSSQSQETQETQHDKENQESQESQENQEKEKEKAQEAEADAVIGKSQADRERQLLVSLPNADLLNIIRAIQAALAVLRTKYLQAAIPIPDDTNFVERSFNAALPDSPNGSDSDSAKNIVLASSPSPSPTSASPLPSSSSFTLPPPLPFSATTTKPKRKPEFIHDTAKYSPYLLNKFKLGWWGPIGMILECSTREEIVELFDRTKSVWDSQEEDYDSTDIPFVDDDDTSKVTVESSGGKLFLVDTIIQILKERNGVDPADIEWV